MTRFTCVLAMSTLALFAAYNARACSCVTPLEALDGPVTYAFNSATWVLLGEVAEAERAVRKEKEANGVEYSSTIQNARIRVLKSWKGDKKEGDILLTSTPVDCCLCGFEVQPGQRVMIYGYGQEPVTLSICSRTKVVDSSSRDTPILDALARGEHPKESGRRAVDIVVPIPRVKIDTNLIARFPSTIASRRYICRSFRDAQ